jgi:hypothetical protein
MYPKNMFDLVITHDKEEKDKIMKPTEAFQLQNGSTYTYINSFSKDFYLYPKDYYFGDDKVLVLNQRASFQSTSSSSITRESLPKLSLLICCLMFKWTFPSKRSIRSSKSCTF